MPYLKIMKKSDFLNHSVIVTILLIFSVSINLLLAYTLWENRKSYSALENAIEYDKGVLPGEKVPSLTAFDLNNEEINISYKDKPTVLYVFTPDCGWCLKNLENLKTLVTQTKNAYSFIGISLKNNNLDQYIKNNEINFPIYHSPPKDVYRDYKMGRTPQTFVISPDGYVIATWAGAFEGENRKQIEEFFDVSLTKIKGE